MSWKDINKIKETFLKGAIGKRLDHIIYEFSVARIREI